MARAFMFNSKNDGGIQFSGTRSFSCDVDGPGTHFAASPDVTPEQQAAGITSPAVFKGL
ncbi:MAG: hypothetical protein V4621_06220 [Pseudomonadota bacterium]